MNRTDLQIHTYSYKIVTFCSVNWRHLPRSSTEEFSMLSVLDRLAVAELKLNRVYEASSSHKT